MTDSLLSDLQALTGPDRKIDAEIALDNGWTKMPNMGLGDYWQSPDNRICPSPPRYTESLDAVEPLLADVYYLFAKGKTRPDEPLYGVQLFKADGGKRGSFLSEHIVAQAEHDLGPVALLIAIYKMKKEIGK